MISIKPYLGVAVAVGVILLTAGSVLAQSSTNINANQNAGLPLSSSSKVDGRETAGKPAAESESDDIIQSFLKWISGASDAEGSASSLPSTPTGREYQPPASAETRKAKGRTPPVNAADRDDTNTPWKPAQITGNSLELKRLESYLNSITTIVSDFTQIAPDGSLTRGKFYLERPGKMRWQYHPPTPVLMITNGSNLIYYDSELEQVSHIPLDSSLASFLARERIDLNDPQLQVERLTRASGVLRITLSRRGKPEEGRITLEFSDQPLQIRNMIVTDSERQVTTISLNRAQFGKPLASSLFVWVDPRKRR